MRKHRNLINELQQNIWLDGFFPLKWTKLKDWVWEVSIIISSIRMELCTEEIVSLKDIEIVKMSYIICLNQSGPILSCRRTMNIEQHLSVKDSAKHMGMSTSCYILTVPAAYLIKLYPMWQLYSLCPWFKSGIFRSALLSQIFWLIILRKFVD
jgi:hypothetical protein